MRRYFVLTGALSLGYGSIYTLLADLRDQFGFRETELGVITGAGFLAGFVAQLGLARLADRGHTGRMVRSGLACSAAAMWGCAFGDALWAFVGSRVLLGVGAGMAMPALRRLVILHATDVGASLGRQMAWDLGGFVLGPSLAAVLAEVGGIRAPFLCFGALFAVLLVWSLRLELTAAAEPPAGHVDGSLLRLRPLRAALLMAIAFYTTVGVFESVWAVLLRDHGAQTWLIGLTLSLFTIPMIFLAPIGGRVAQRRGPLRTVAVSVAAATVCTFSYGVIDALWALLAVLLIHAAADSFTMPGNQVAVAIAAPRDRLAAAQGLLGATGVASAGLAGLAAGAAYERFGSFAVFGGAAALMASCLVGAAALTDGFSRASTGPRPVAASDESSAIPAGGVQDRGHVVFET
jgi:MFS family permease